MEKAKRRHVNIWGDRSGIPSSLASLLEERENCRVVAAMPSLTMARSWLRDDLASVFACHLYMMANGRRE